MKELINSLYWDARKNLSELKKTDMKLSERIKYEKAMVQLEIMKKILDKQLAS